MKLHRNAALSWNGRRLLAERVVDQGWTIVAAAAAGGVSVRCARKWVSRYRAAGAAGLVDRSSAPARVANRTCPRRVAVIALLRGLRMTAAEIAETLAMPLSTVSGILTRSGLGRLGRLGLEPAVRYERSRPGELVHIDVKKLGRIEGGAGKRVRDGVRQHTRRRSRDAAGVRRNRIGWEYVHIAVDDYSRLAYAEVLPDEKATTAVGFLRRAVAFYRRYGIEIERVITDNGSAYVSIAHAIACRGLRIKHLRTRPYRPQTNGKAPSASSARCSPPGPTARSTAQAANAPQPSTAGSGTTTIADDTQHSATDRRSAEPTSSGPTPRRPGLNCATGASIPSPSHPTRQR
jgi:transposase InsO family protein